MRRHKSAKIGYQWNVREKLGDGDRANWEMASDDGEGEIVDESIIIPCNVVQPNKSAPR